MSTSELYTIETLETVGNAITVAIRLNASHPVFEGHFPGQPVLPGACMLDMVKEVLCVALNHQLKLLKADNLKFITPVDPRQGDQLQLNIAYQQAGNQLKVKATISSGSSPRMKMDGVFLIG